MDKNDNKVVPSQEAQVQTPRFDASDSPVDHLISPLEADSKAYWLYRDVRSAIRSGELEPGRALRMEWLKETFSASTSPCREALARLVGEGFVITEGKKGFRVREISRDDFLSIAELRNQLELSALAKSIENRTLEWESRLVARLHRLRRSSKASPMAQDARDEREKHHRAFHLELLSECPSPWLLRFYDQLASHMERYRRILLRDEIFAPEYVAEIDEEHEKLMDLAIAGNIGQVSDLLVVHRNRTYNVMLERLTDGD